MSDSTESDDVEGEQKMPRSGQMLSKALGRARRSPLYLLCRAAYRRVRKVPRHPLQDFKPLPGFDLVRLGSDYGGWTFVHHGELFGSTIISAGLGEDASFDVEFARTYGARVIIVDPTPRAVKHFNEISSRLGSSNMCGYSGGGAQSVEAYDLRGIDQSNLTLVPQALWKTATTLKFFEPINEKHVSHTLVNFRRDYRDAGNYMVVESITMSDLLRDNGFRDGDSFQLVKLDIEGAEVEVISHFLDEGIRPKQILVEFDELNAPSSESFTRIDLINTKLNNFGYQCIWTDNQVDFLYISDEFRSQLQLSARNRA